MIYIKTYCYSKHELPFLISQLEESYDYVDKVCIYEYNYTHTGVKKEYDMEKVLQQIPETLREKLYYNTVDLTNYHVASANNEQLCHQINEPIQRNWFFNDKNIDLNDDDIILDVDCDEIIYRESYPKLINELTTHNQPFSIKLNQFFFKHNYLWTDCKFSSPTIYYYKMVKNNSKIIKQVKIKNLRDLPKKTESIHGCHMSWVMPVDCMVDKCFKTAHTRYKHLADANIMKKAINDKIYIFDTRRPFNIDELLLNDPRIPEYLQKENIFDSL
jgi:hypothetical protein